MLDRSPQAKYQLTDNGEFIITDYNSAKLFSSFFPGIAGKNGIPMWTFYVNRGQCVCSMGIEGKHHPIMEFLPANWAYNLVSTQGFRTFIKLVDQSSNRFYEPFQNKADDQQYQKAQRMIIAPAKLTLEEVNKTLGLKFSVEYFNIPQENYAGLVRRLTIQNLNPDPVRLQVLDGLPLIVPYGLDDYGLKHMRRLFEAFVEVTNFENKVPFYKLKVEPSDRPDVVRIKKGNFYLGFMDDSKLVDPIYDPVKIFGIRGDYAHPERFLSSSSEELAAGQIYENRLPCAMGSFETTIATHRTCTYTSVIGHAGSASELNELVPNIVHNGYIERKAVANQEIVSALTQKNFICSAELVLDQYARQNFLDNVMRGGFPHTLKGRESSSVLHLYSRKHGDLERDYNDYRLTPTPYSQGNGHFRDVNQNRRCDLFFNPQVAEGNVLQFASLIQLDGFNPLVVKESRFSISQHARLDEVLGQYLDPGRVGEVAAYLQDTYTPGELLLHLHDRGIAIKGDANIFIGDLLGISAKHYGTEPGEGFWIDHWTYNLDLLENFLAVYPEQKKQILFENKTFTFYDNPQRVQPRDEKYVIWGGRAMQLNSVVLDKEKELLISQRCHDQNKVRMQYGQGEVYKTTLFTVMLSLITNKLASLDPEGVGVEMEADKPGWYDALNGMPGLIGSSLCETLELKRHILFLLDTLAGFFNQGLEFAVYEELHEFIATLSGLLGSGLSAFEFWDRATALKENYRAKTRLGVSGKEKNITLSELIDFLQASLQKLDAGIARAWNNDVVSTYFINEAVEYDQITVPSRDGSLEAKCNAKGLSCFRAKKFNQVPLPLFLEGPVHFLRAQSDPQEARKLAAGVRNSGLYDAKLKMYKVNESLADQPMEIGRARTFSPGWFENESIWLHMEYKYMLELLRNGLHAEFFRDFKQVFVPFFDPEVYGRSILENSSFIVSSANPDPSLHGNGFVARLSGATAEFIHILHLMTVGQNPFELDSAGELRLNLKPVLPGWLFTPEARRSRLLIGDAWQDVQFEADTFSFMFLGKILVTYLNPSRKDTFGPDSVSPASWKVLDLQGISREFQTAALSGEIVRQIRAREILSIAVELR
ncbi:MAG: hypothetical protein K0B87_00345 [Candidatus Syntrophosphaera sp.]|nr:hypothetical protein [Candidatus Syntrophosphaera sp.]